MRAKIIGTGHYSPARVVTNDELSKRVETSDAWIRERTGIGARRIAADGETTSDMIVAAAKQALEMAGVRGEDLDLIVVGTISGDMPMPATACFVQARLGAKRAAAWDLSAACAGFLFGLATAEKFIRLGEAKYALVVGAELLSRLTDWTDRNTCVLFGDGAGAVVLGPSHDDTGVLSTHIHTDGTLTGILTIPGGGSADPASHEMIERREQFIKMNGREVFKHAVRNIAASCDEALKANGLKPDDIDWVIAHQANLRIIEGVSERVGIPLSRFFLNIEQYGNTSSASIPTALNEAHRAGLLKPGQKLLFAALGAGLAWGSAVVRW
ncbi:MAG: ketoacyl-ACP synthase III [Deltaproteobacteria bacterium]|nr:ketoacyl-ACP synthase III [Deltaproteobacteria bacterium]